MARGGARPGAGRPKGSGKRKLAPPAAPASQQHVDGGAPARPRFESAREFGIWALNAPDDQVTMAEKLRAMQVLAMLEAKKDDRPTKQEEQEAGVASAMQGKFAPRTVKGFGVVDGSKR